jgi:hypothetical protein
MNQRLKKTIKIAAVVLIAVGSLKAAHRVGEVKGINEMRRRILMNPEEVLQMIKEANDIGQETQ